MLLCFLYLPPSHVAFDIQHNHRHIPPCGERLGLTHVAIALRRSAVIGPVGVGRRRRGAASGAPAALLRSALSAMECDHSTAPGGIADARVAPDRSLRGIASGGSIRYA